MKSIDKEEFTAAYESAFGRLKADAKADLQILLAFFADDKHMNDIRWISYCLATAKHETGHTFSPVEEIGKGKGKAYGKKNPRTGVAYYGRGYVQLTHLDNYDFMGKVLGVDLVMHPALALKYDVAYKIMSYGMRNGTFTGVKLGKYINDDRTDYVSARRIINGQDCAGRISGYATAFERILKGCTE